MWPVMWPVTWCVDLQGSTTALLALMMPSWLTSSTLETSSPSLLGPSPESASEAWRPRWRNKYIFFHIQKNGSDQPDCYWLAAVSLIWLLGFLSIWYSVSISCLVLPNNGQKYTLLVFHNHLFSAGWVFILFAEVSVLADFICFYCFFVTEVA